MKHNKIYTAIGLLLLAAALFLTGYNLWSDAQADKSANAVLEQLVQASSVETPHLPTLPDGESLEETYIPDYILNPEEEMPSEEIDGNLYIGILKIPAISLELPIIADWSYSGLRIAPCRYSGSAYLGDLIIAGHNYLSHFGYLKTLSPGNEVTFTDADGNVFRYEVSEIEVLSPYAVTEMTSGDWDLTLFTCTVGGQSRVTVRCAQVNNAS